MKRMILAINICKYEDIVSNISEVYAHAVSNPNVLDVIVFLPEMGTKMVDTVSRLSEVISSSGYLGRTHFLVSEEDKENVPFDYWFYLKEIFPKVSICSKDDVRVIGDISFQAFSSKNFYPDELEEFINHLYEKANDNDVEYCFVVDSSNDEDMLKNISSKFVCLKAGKVKSFISSKYNYDEVVGDYHFELEKINKSIEELENSSFFINSEKKEMAYVDGPVLKKSSGSTKKKGNK